LSVAENNISNIIRSNFFSYKQPNQFLAGFNKSKFIRTITRVDGRQGNRLGNWQELSHIQRLRIFRKPSNYNMPGQASGSLTLRWDRRPSI
jgi:hypothetical protein